MTNSIFFNVREGNTNLTREDFDGIKLKHIRNMKQLDEAEAVNILEGLNYVENHQSEDILNLEFAKKLHKKLFGHVWKWGGEFRKSEKNIGIVPYKISTELLKLLENTKYQIQEKSYEPEEIGARFHHGLVFIHPFQNGNGRWARIYTELLYKKKNWSLPNWHSEEEILVRRKRYIDALRQADRRIFSDLIQFMRHAST